MQLPKGKNKLIEKVGMFWGAIGTLLFIVVLTIPKPFVNSIISPNIILFVVLQEILLCDYMIFVWLPSINNISTIQTQKGGK